MLPQAFWISLRILLFRSGPEDVPFDPGRRLSAACIVFGVLANAAMAAISAQAAVSTKALPSLPPLPFMLLIGVATVLAMGVFTRLALRARQLENRYQQTFNALLLTSSIITLLMILPIHALLPFLPEAEAFSRKMQEHPELLDQNAALPIPPWVLLLSLLIPWLLVWQFAVTAFIYRRAANTRTGGGVLIAALCVLSILSFKTLFSALLG